MKILFLDIDGVLVTPSSMGLGYAKVQGHHFHHFQKSCVDALNRITRETGAVFVVSSTWRLYGQELLTEHLKNEGVEAPIIGLTPRNVEEERSESGLIITGDPRGLEIQKWMDDNKHLNIEAFTIIDDSADMRHLTPKLVRTVWRDEQNRREMEGLTEERADEAIQMLGESHEPRHK